jgi:hypothetical protein
MKCKSNVEEWQSCAPGRRRGLRGRESGQKGKTVVADEWEAAGRRDTVQSMPEYRGQTTLIFSPDHDRGDGRKWRDHGGKVPSSKYIWMAFLGPDTPALGERSNIPAVTQNQIAATLADFLGEDYTRISQGRKADC